ncbi:MAG: hypothetical protein LUE97_06745 [Oscillospiraceae bacterium]|nr:hypothetical protein [Oscillospiraceae bacterium]
MGTDCKHCGAYISSGMEKCPACGHRVKAEKPDWDDDFSAAARAREQKAYEAEAESARESEYHYTYNNSKEYKRERREHTERGSEVQTAGGIFYLCYLGPLALVPLLMGRHKDSDFALFHCNQGLVLLLVEVVLGFFGFAGVICGIFELWCAMTGLISVHRGTMKELPLIHQITLLKR